MLVLEGAQAGLSWSTILHKRTGYRAAFAGFDAEAVAGFGPADVERLLADPGIVRNRLKVASAITNARAVLAVREAHGSLDAFLWGLVPGAPVRRGPTASSPCRDRRVTGSQQGAEAARVPLRRAHGLLRVHAGRRHGRRSRPGCYRYGAAAP